MWFGLLPLDEDGSRSPLPFGSHAPDSLRLRFAMDHVNENFNQDIPRLVCLVQVLIPNVAPQNLAVLLIHFIKDFLSLLRFVLWLDFAQDIACSFLNNLVLVKVFCVYNIFNGHMGLLN